MPKNLGRRRKPTKSILTLAQGQHLIDAARQNPARGFYAAFSFLAGTRPSEQLGLLWEDVDLVERVIVWDSPSLMGFLFRAAWGENDVATYSLRWAGEHHGFQIAAGIGMQQQSRAGQIDASGPTVVSATSLYGLGSQAARPADDWGTSLAVKHVPSGIFVQGHYAWSNYRVSAGNAADKTQSNWLIQAGLARNWFGLGDTAGYVEYGEGNNNVFETPATLATAGAGSFSGMFGLGVNQKIDAAAMEIYAGWRRYSLSTTNVAAGAAGLEDIDIVFTGARIRF